MLWMQEMRPSLKKKYPELSITEMSKKAGEMWKALVDKSVRGNSFMDDRFVEWLWMIIASGSWFFVYIEMGREGQEIEGTVSKRQEGVWKNRKGTIIIFVISSEKVMGREKEGRIHHCKEIATESSFAQTKNISSCLFSYNNTGQLHILGVKSNHHHQRSLHSTRVKSLWTRMSPLTKIRKKRRRRKPKWLTTVTTQIKRNNETLK